MSVINKFIIVFSSSFLNLFDRIPVTAYHLQAARIALAEKDLAAKLEDLPQPKGPSNPGERQGVNHPPCQ